MAALAAAGCGKSAGTGGRDDAGADKPGGIPEVGYVVMQPTSVPITLELGGRLTAFEKSDVRPQVSGVIRRRLFKEGSVVKTGDTLYEIDSSLYKAAVDQARANLASAGANEQAARALSERYKLLVDDGSISKQDYANAVASAKVNEAAIMQARAALETAQINLGFTTVPAPISGRIGRSLVTVGALVAANQAEPLAQIQRLDPIFVDMQQSAADLLALRRSLGHDGIVASSVEAQLVFEDGSIYGETGRVEFAETLVNSATGTVTLRARFANPRGELLPGMFVRARFSQLTNTRSFLVPQLAVMRDAKGSASVYVVGAGDKAVLKQITTTQTQGQDWIVTEGLAPNDKVIVQGLVKIGPNRAVKAVPASTQPVDPQEIAGRAQSIGRAGS